MSTGLVARNLLLLTLVPLAGMVAATQYVASALRDARPLGPPLVTLGAVRVYAPWSAYLWMQRFEHRAPHAFEVAMWIGYGTLGATFALLLLSARLGARAKAPPSTYGTARWASDAELERAGLLGEAGVVLCQTHDAVYVPKPSPKGAPGWKMNRMGRLIRHGGPEHVFCFAPTRSGKGVGLVIPTLLSWNASVLVYDIKKELWTLSAGWRRQFSHCWRFEPTDPTSVRFNPLAEVRLGVLEVRDAQNIADILVDPEGSGDKRDHWQATAHSLLVATILHVLYAETDKSLGGLVAFLSDPARTQFDTLKRMLTYPHLASGPHPAIAGTAREMLNKSDNELSGVFSTAMACFGLYRDPIVARNVSTSDFRIADLMNAAHPVSLYLVVAPSDIDRTRPLVRLLLNQFGRRLTERMTCGADKGYKHKLLLLLDEFPSLGRLPFFEAQLAFIAGYGIKAFLIAQSLSQLEKAYGPANAILDNSHIRVTYGALDEKTARRISDLLGQCTKVKSHVSLGGKRGALFRDHVTESEQEHARPLLTPGEVLQLPADEALLMVGGLYPYRAKKVMYYQDARFKHRDRLPPPEGPAQQAAELLARPLTREPLRPRAETPRPVPALSPASPPAVAPVPAPLSEAWTPLCSEPDLTPHKEVFGNDFAPDPSPTASPRTKDETIEIKL